MNLKHYLGILSLTALIAGCAGMGSQTSENLNDDMPSSPKKGGSFRFSSTEYVQTLYPPAMLDLVSYQVGSQIYEGLLKIDVKTMEPVPSLARDWSIDSSGTLYTFHLRNDVYFHDDPCFPGGKGRKMTAQDVEFSLLNLCTHGPHNQVFELMFSQQIKGADEYYVASKQGTPSFDLAGVKVLNDSTLTIELSRPSSLFSYVLCMPPAAILAPEAVNKHQEKLTIGTGPFQLAPYQSLRKDHLVLIRNTKYYGKDEEGFQLPYLDSLELFIYSTKLRELAAFENKEIDFVYGLPSRSVKKIVEDKINLFEGDNPVYHLDRLAEMGTNYYVFNLTNAVFKDKRVRQAINYAIDREKIVNGILQGEAYGPLTYGITPPSFKGYENQDSGYTFHPDKARFLLAEAGYPNGEGFPNIKLEVNSGGTKNTSVAFEVRTQLKEVLNINLDVDVVSFEQKLEDEKYGRADMFRSAWGADIPDPSNFLFLFYGKSVPQNAEDPSIYNVGRYTNEKFDYWYEQGVSASNRQKAYGCFAKAEQILVEDAPALILWYNQNYLLIRSNIKNFYSNPLNYRDYSVIYKTAELPEPDKGQKEKGLSQK